MASPKPYNEETPLSNEPKGKRKAHYCDLESQDDVACNNEKFGTSLVSDRVTIPSSSQHLNLVGKELCRNHYNRLIVNPKNQLANTCSHPKHNLYRSTARKSKEEKKLKKTPERLIKFFGLPPEMKMCNHCLYETDKDPEYINMLNYPQAKERALKENLKQFKGRSYVLRGDVIYSEAQFQEFETAYNEVCAELDEAKLESIPLNKKIKLIAGALYTRQRVYNKKPILDPEEFKKMLEEAEPSLKGFFNQLVAGTNPQNKNNMTNEKNKKRLVLFCYFLAGLNNKLINGIKAEVGFLLDAAGTSSSAIETLAGAGLSIKHITVARQKAQHSEEHTATVGNFLTDNKCENLVVLNVDDFHNIHEYCHCDVTDTHDIRHFVTILLEALPEVAPIPFYNPNNHEKIIHNEGGIDATIIILNAHTYFFSHLWLSYTGRKQAFNDLVFEPETHDEQVKRLLIHSYDDRIEQRRTDRSMENTKLVDLIEGSLKSTDDYVKAVKCLIDIPEIKTYMETQVLVAPMDYPGQLNIRRAITSCIKSKDSSGIPEQILHIVPMIGPLHVSLNSHETVFLLNYLFFDKLFHKIFGENKVLAKTPKPYKINLLLELASQGWSRVRLQILRKFERSKDLEARYLINLLDNIVPLVLDFYPIIFRSGNWIAYKEAMFRVWAIFYQYQRQHYNKLPLAFLSDVFFWSNTNHPISHVLSDSLHIFNDYYVENFHSSLRRQIQESNTAEQIIRQARTIDQMRGGNTFTNTFSEDHNIRYSAKQLEYLEKNAALFLLELLTDIYMNIGQSKVVFDESSETESYELPTLGAKVDVKILPMAWNTVHPPQEDRYCDLEGCIDSSEVGCILICGHAYHYECFLFNLESQCRYCVDYLVSGIKHNCKAFQKTLESSSKIEIDKDINEGSTKACETRDSTNISVL